MKICLKYKIFLLGFLLLTSTYKTEAQIIIRLWEAEASATANVTTLALIKSAEVQVKNKMKNLNNQLRQKIPYYGLMTVFNPIFQINPTIVRIQRKIGQASLINNSVPLFFNRKKDRKRRKFTMYTRYIASLMADVGTDFSNNGNLLKTAIEIISELEEIEKDLDKSLESLIVAQRIFTFF